ncbi:hypothetical protein GGF38_003097 [Coemansia sp. RSA 25]|nr:hypothetical protein GGF38_003097 [Coemansia sp. RSA 25]
MDDSQHKAADESLREPVEQAASTGSVKDGISSISSSNTADDDTKESASGSDSGSDEEEEDEEDEPSIFVAEEAYAPLDDDDGVNEVSSDLPSSIDDAFQCRSTATADAIPADIEQELDNRIEAELATKQALETKPVRSQRRIDPPMEVTVGRSDKMSDEHIGQIKSIMAGIQLSDAAIPEWSRRVPEGSWMPRRRTVSSAQKPTIPDQSTR